MWRFWLGVAFFFCVVQVAVPAFASNSDDPYFAQDLQKANADPRYAHLTKPADKVRVYRLHNYFPGDWDKLDPRFEGVVTGEAAARQRAGVLARNVVEKPKKLASAKPNEVLVSAAAPKAAVVTPAVTKALKQVATTTPPDDRWYIYVRKSFTDLYSITAPNSTADSTGASFSYTDNQIAKNTTWAGQGAIFGGYTYIAPQFNLQSQPFLLGFSAGPYYTFNKATNSNSADKSKNIDSETYGGAAELGVGNFLGVDRLTTYTRVTAGDVRDNIKGTDDFSATATFLPVYDPLLIHWPHGIPTSSTTDIKFRFDPSFLIQYDSLEGSKQPLAFSNRSTALRVGPQVALWLVPFDGVPYLTNIVSTTTYHWAFETYSGRSLHWFESDWTYKINPALGLSFQYKNGTTEDTGANTKQYMISLSAAFDYCNPDCPSSGASTQ